MIELNKEKMQLTVEEAYRSMVVFLEMHYARTNSDDIGSLLGDLILLEDGSTADPAMWKDWLDSIQLVKVNQIT